MLLWNVRLFVLFCLTLILSFVCIFFITLWMWASYLRHPFYWHFVFSVMSAELDCHPSAGSLVLNWVDLQLTLNNVSRFNSKFPSLLSVFWNFLVLSRFQYFFSSGKNKSDSSVFIQPQILPVQPCTLDKTTFLCFILWHSYCTSYISMLQFHCLLWPLLTGDA